MKLQSPLGLDICCLPFLRDVFREFVGTTLFLFTSLSSVVLWPHLDPLHVALAFGASIALTCVCLDGVHLNPAVTLALVVGLRVSPWQAVLYVGAQLLGAITACGLLFGMAPVSAKDKLGINEVRNEFVCLYIYLYLSVNLSIFITYSSGKNKRPLQTFTSTINRKNKCKKEGHFPLLRSTGKSIQIGFTGCGMNPARSFGPAVLTLNLENHWVFWAGPCAGAILAWLMYDLLLYPRWTGLSDWIIEFRQVFLTSPSKQPTNPQSNTEI
uniref:Aquaporin 5 n=1 Tax=Astyanax mexicanus TaxID=7994 RepID=A0A3B1ITL2_ASTMX